ncbi:hypothetical protein AXK11_00135 [Cephaloticoccus primus]|uniref:Na/Pi cotransporter n=1 Tax=Cephaloticoccus primus TaxID=1548207 RepID=A0A139ST77_9BACT|nr:Na/Pi symporter [Cephaloticoccus primus]KXU37682.1 hypothetical protein AXK11_00135 [Cephaloticoccus primus]
MIAQLLGGIGLFLLGILLLTDGLRTAAGQALKRILSQFTERSSSAFLSGLTITAMVQSSSATTLATIGFVSAGLITFSQSIGVIIGSSVGTTTTGWIVSLLGLKLSLFTIAMPLVGIGALMRLMLKGRIASVGFAIAGFGLIFIGIDTLQHGMNGLAAHVQPESFPEPSFSGRLILVAIGIVLTVIMQASSAAVATAITAYHSGTLDITQALSIVIGASIGTTLTAGLAAIGASVSARRTALVHVLFNSFSATIGFGLLPLYVWLLTHVMADGSPPGAWSIAVFHTLFHVIGAGIVLPGGNAFSKVITRLIPERKPAPTSHLDDSLAQVPEVAVEALRRALVECTLTLTAWIKHRSDARFPEPALPLEGVKESLAQCYAFLTKIPATIVTKDEAANPRLSLIHALDHLDQIVGVLSGVHSFPDGDPSGRLEQASQKLAALFAALERSLIGTGEQPAREGASEEVGSKSAAADAALAEVEQLSHALAQLRRSGRHALLRETAEAALSPAKADELLDAVRWMDTSAYHLWRTAYHLGLAADPVKEGTTASKGHPGKAEATARTAAKD